MAVKKYYWLKLKKDFFSRHDIRIIESMPNGKEYVLFYLKLMAESVSHEGNLRFSDTIPYDENMLATITNTNVDIVRAAMGILKQLNLMEVLDDQTIYMNEVERLIGAETEEHIREQARIRQQRYRDKKELESHDEALHNADVTHNEALHNVTVTLHRNAEIEKEIEKEKELDKELDSVVPAKPKPKRFVKPSVEDVRAYCMEKGYKVDPDRFVSYYESNGWRVGRNPMKDWKAAVRTWTKNNYGTTAKKTGFTDFKDRDINYDDLERKLLGY